MNMKRLILVALTVILMAVALNINENTNEVARGYYPTEHVTELHDFNRGKFPSKFATNLHNFDGVSIYPSETVTELYDFNAK
jgi:hypothetical protein